VADEIIGVARDNALSTFGILRSLGNGLTSFSSFENTNWPFVTIPDFQHRSHDYLAISGAELVAFSPIVSPREFEEWSNYSVANQGWIEESLTTTFSYSHSNSSSSSNNFPSDGTPEPIPERIWRISEATSNSLPDLTQQNQLVPLWQMYPAPLDTSVVNFNLRSHVNFEKAFALSESTEKTVLSDIFQKRELSVINPNLAFDIPRSLVIQPVRESFEPQAAIAGFLLVVIPWDIIFDNVLSEGTPPLMCVMRSSCGSSFSYLVDGPRATFLGNQDHHDPKYDSMKTQSLFPEFDTDNLIGDSVTQYCEYSLSTYPTAEFEEVYRNSQPVLNMTVVLAVFGLTSLLFLVYDRLVERLKRKVIKQAQRSNAIVNSLFPAEVQDRLYKAAEESRKSVSKAPKHLLQNFLSDADKQQQGITDPSANPIPGQAYKTKPIADLFLECTVMFADISGFTAWSSVREPSQVFALLECIYNAFDAIARKFKVFKVETIGDCYVAVCGLPDPNPRHAVVMAGFAHKCLLSMNSLMQELEVTLGPDTSELAMRFGLHSGPVTAGVLRGEKSRFQLFGDTVNTTARMESSGVRNRIHCSEATATCLIALGKGHWTRKREEKVHLKGKGEMQTYWLRPKLASGMSEKSDEETESESGSNSFEPAKLTRAFQRKSQVLGASNKDVHAKTQRLVDWVSNMLLPLLEQVVDQREASRVVNQDFARLSKAELAVVAAESGCTKALEQVQEIITLPRFDAKVAERHASAEKVHLSETVKKQVNALVGSLAALYHENPFHNFEHASHVSMSIGMYREPPVAGYTRGKSNLFSSPFFVSSSLSQSNSCLVSSLPKWKGMSLTMIPWYMITRTVSRRIP
jgi:class 3 adenylate cyclase